jgi:hydrogenase large subunit
VAYPEVEQHDRAEPGADVLPGLCGRLRPPLHREAGHTKTWTPFTVPDEGIGCGFTEAVRGVLSHHMVIRDGKIANYHPYPPTPWNANPRDKFGTVGPYEDAVQDQPIFEENDRANFKGIDIMRTVRSFDPCLPCGVHMYDGGGTVLERHHSPAGFEQT